MSKKLKSGIIGQAQVIFGDAIDINLGTSQNAESETMAIGMTELKDKKAKDSDYQVALVFPSSEALNKFRNILDRLEVEQKRARQPQESHERTAEGRMEEEGKDQAAAARQNTANKTMVTKEEIRQILDTARKNANELFQKLGEAEFSEFINLHQFYYNGLPCGQTFSDFLTECVYHDLTATEREAYKKWAEEHLTRISSEKVWGPRGECYVYVELFDGEIYAVGEEQGNYSGGHTASMHYGGRKKISDNITRFKDDSNDLHHRFYEQIKDVPIMTDDEYEQMKQQRQQWPQDFDHWTWFE